MGLMDLPLGDLKTLEEKTGMPLGKLMTAFSTGDYTVAMLEGLVEIADPDVDVSDLSFEDALGYVSGGSGKE